MTPTQKLIEAAEAVCDRWDSPLWKDAKPTADYIATLREAVRGLREAQAEPVARFCPGCGSVGPVPAQYRDCCPDGNKARVIPESLARNCRDLFQLALRAPSDPDEIAAPPSPAPQPAQDGGEVVAWMLRHEDGNWNTLHADALAAQPEWVRKHWASATPLYASTPPAAEPVAAEAGAVSGERAAFVQEVMTLAENIADAEHAGPTVRRLHRRFLREFLERAALSAQPQKAGQGTACAKG